MYNDSGLIQLYQLIDKNNNQLRLGNKTNEILQYTVMFQQEVINETQKTIDGALARLRTAEEEYYAKFNQDLLDSIKDDVMNVAEKFAQEKYDLISNDPAFRAKLTLMVTEIMENILKDL